MMSKVMLTTVDNPYSPFDEFEEWYVFDVTAGYHTASFLGRIVKTSDQLSEADQDVATELAIDEIVKENTLGVYRKVVKEE
jgi:hypothetical protein